MAYLTIKEYAEKWHVSYSHVYRAVKNGLLKAVQVGKRDWRIPENEIFHFDGENAVPHPKLTKANWDKLLEAI